MSANEILKSHPRKKFVELKEYTACITACIACADICNSCADACLGEEKNDMLKKCIRLNLDCVDICTSTARILGRQTEPAPQFMRIQLDACAAICGTCAQECELHAEMHHYCRICAETCRECERSCLQLLAALPGGAKAESQPLRGAANALWKDTAITVPGR